MRRIYLDANGSSPPLIPVQEKLLLALPMMGNPSSFHAEGRTIRVLIDEARSMVAQAVVAQDKEVVFTSGASEANRLFVDALIIHAQNHAKKLSVLMSPFEHPSLLKPLFAAHDAGHFCLTVMDLTSDGLVIIPALDEVDVIIMTQAHNETGILCDLSYVCENAPKTALIMSDISQGLARLEPLPKRVDVMTCSAQKVGAFAGSGAIIFRGNSRMLKAPWSGGGQERGFRPGTESSLLISAFGQACALIQEQRSAHQKLLGLRDFFEQELALSLSVNVVGKNWPRLPNTSAITFIHEDEDALRIAFDMAQLAVGFGAACSGLAPEGSFALKRLKLSLEEEKRTVRFSFCHNTSEADLKEAISRIKNRVVSHKSRV